jgi:hypothetical protein
VAGCRHLATMARVGADAQLPPRFGIKIGERQTYCEVVAFISYGSSESLDLLQLCRPRVAMPATVMLAATASRKEDADMESTIRLFWQRLKGAVHPEDRVALASHPHTFDLRFPPPAFIGDVDHAPLVVLMLNGGVAADLQAAEFPTPGDSTEYIDWLAGRRKKAPTRLSPYYTRNRLYLWIESGQAVIVNAIAYRSHSITNEPANKKMRKILPSALLHRRWLMNEVLPAVKAGKRKVIAHRPSLWDLDRTIHADFLFSTNPVSEHLSEAMRECASRWLASRH